MATKLRVPSSFANVAPGKTAIADLKTGADCRYHQIQIKYQDGNASPVDILTALGDIRVKYDAGKILRIHSAAELDQMNGTNGAQYKVVSNGTGVGKTQTITIYFAELWRKSPVEQDALALNADSRNGINTLQIEVDIAAGASATCALSVVSIRDNTLPPAPGGSLVSKIYRQSFAAAGVSMDIPANTFPAGDRYQAFYFRNPSGATFINRARLTLGPITVHDLNQDENIGLLTNADMIPSASTTAGQPGYDLVLDHSDSVLDAMFASAPPQVKLYFATLVSNVITATAASGSVTVLVQRLGLLD